MRHIDKKHLPVHEEVVVDVAIVGAGAAGLFAAIWAGKKGGKHSIQIEDKMITDAISNVIDEIKN